jgi:hydroxymethylbilane synthase
LLRLGLGDRAAEVLEPEILLPQVGQGALAVECRAEDEETAQLLAQIEDARARRAVDAERAFLARLGGGCDLPVAAYSTEDGDGTLTVDGMLASLDGRIMLRDRATGAADEAAKVGADLADSLLSDSGGAALLEDLGL